jgi:hypothetical protein
MSECTCGAKPTASTDEVVEAEKSEALEEPIVEEDLDKQEELYKDMEATLAKLKEVMAYLEEMGGGEEKQEEEEPEEEEEEEEEEPEEEEKADEDEDETLAEKAEDLHKSISTLKKYGINVYTGRKATPAPRINTPKAEAFDWNSVDKSWEELEENIGDN